MLMCIWREIVKNSNSFVPNKYFFNQLKFTVLDSKVVLKGPRSKYFEFSPSSKRDYEEMLSRWNKFELNESFANPEVNFVDFHC